MSENLRNEEISSSPLTVFVGDAELPNDQLGWMEVVRDEKILDNEGVIPLFPRKWVSIDSIDFHPAALATYRDKDLSALRVILEKVGQLEPIAVVRRGDLFQVWDGISRVIAARQLGWSTILVELYYHSDQDLMSLHSLKNFRTKRPFSEQILKAEAILGVLGNSQGKKREYLDKQGQSITSLEGKDRMALACAIGGLSMSASTLRKAIQINDFVTEGDEEVLNLGLPEKIDSGLLSIDRAFKLVKNYEEAIKIRQEESPIEEGLNYANDARVKFYHSSCTDLSQIDDQSIQLVITSPPYFQLRNYGVATDGESELGLDKTAETYVARLLSLIQPIKRVLKDEGSLVVNLGETFQNGKSCIVTNLFVVEMVKDGWHLVGEIIWQKTNAKPTNKKGLQDVTEKLFHFVKDPVKAKVRAFKIWRKDERISLEKGCNDHSLVHKKKKEPSFYIKKDMASLTNVLDAQHVANLIKGPIFHWSEIRSIDVSFAHEAPAPAYLALVPVLMTTEVGDTVLDIFCGAGGFLDLAVRLGRNVIGIDIDANNINFAKKRLLLAKDEALSDDELRHLGEKFEENSGLTF